jgi:hypothetical protein
MKKTKTAILSAVNTLIKKCGELREEEDKVARN